ncbi:MAG: YCF48-related protein [Ignavibacteria bacterium]|nr:YCF48-related protein [Ignavibacteria bacterium]
MENLFLKCSLVVLLFFIADLRAQSINTLEPDSAKEKPIEFRRNVEANSTLQTYEEQYRDKNLSEEKKRLFPLGFEEKKFNKTERSTGTWTELNPKVPRVDYVGIYFINKDTGWAVGDLGALIKTTDGGGSWKVIETNTTKPILKIRSYNGTTVIASGYDGLILRSTDGGETFVQVISGVGNGIDIWGLEIVNDSLGWACGATALLKTTDAGESWQIVNIQGYTGNLWAIEFLNDTYGFLAADGKVLRTTDGGTNWEIIQAGDNQPLYSIDIIDSLHIAAAGYGGTSYRGKNIYSSDGGYTWINGGPLTFEPVNDIKYVNKDTGYVVMNNTIGFKTTNRGQQWTGVAVGGDWEMQFLIEQNIGYSIGTGLRVYKTDKGFENWHRLIINDNFADVFFVSERKGFAISGVLSTYQGLYKTTNGGINWNGVPGPSGQDLFFLDSLTGFVGSDVIYKTTDGGTTWYIPNGGQGGAGKIFFINETIGWAIRSNVIYKTTDRGENWVTQFTAPSSIGFESIYFVDSLSGWSANLGGRPYKTTDGGENWVQQTNLDLWNSDDVYFTNRDTGWIAIYSSINPSLYKTTNGGLNWFAISEVVGARKFHFFPDPIHWLIIGFSRYYITNDHGNSWLEFTENVPSGLVSFYAPNNNLGYSVGSGGLILKYFDTTYVPVELILFEGKVENNKIVLFWGTATELNNQGFYIEKSFDKKNWFDIGFIEGKGTTVELSYYSFTDNEIASNVHFYRLKQVDYDGSYEYSKIIEISLTLKLSSFHLFQNYPNPYNSSTIITYQIPQKSFVNISLYDIKGEKIIELLNEEKEKGLFKTALENNQLTSGIYFVRMITSTGFSEITKITLIK